jgi:hypothetical protein
MFQSVVETSPQEVTMGESHSYILEIQGKRPTDPQEDLQAAELKKGEDLIRCLIYGIKKWRDEACADDGFDDNCWLLMNGCIIESRTHKYAGLSQLKIGGQSVIFWKEIKIFLNVFSGWVVTFFPYLFLQANKYFQKINFFCKYNISKKNSSILLHMKI